MQTSLAKYLLDRIEINDDTDCWEWRLSKTNGYGRARVGGIHTFAHVLSYREFVGPTLDFKVLHQCDNPPCINPEHLELGTQADNMKQKVDRGRVYRPKGSDCNLSKLTDLEVESIIAGYDSGVSKHDLSIKYNVWWNTIHRLLKKNGSG